MVKEIGVMLRVPILRNVIRLAGGRPVAFNLKIDRHFSQQLCVPTSLLLHRHTVDRFLQPASAAVAVGANSQISCDFCTESTKSSRKKKQKKNPPAVDHVGRLDLRIGKIVEVNKAPDADTLYLTKVDIGGEFLSIVAGLAKFITADELVGKNVVVLCNLKTSKLRGHSSEGMVMCAKIGDTMELLEPPGNAQPGDLVYCESYDRVPTSDRDKKKLYDSLAPDMLTNDQLIACYKGSYLYLPDKGNIKSKSLKNAPIT